MTSTTTPGRPAPDPRPVLRLRSPSDQIEAVPHLLGFRPTESVVMLCLAGRRRRLLVTARVDLPEGGPAADTTLAAELVRHACRAGAEAVLLSVHTDAAVRSEGLRVVLPREGLVSALTRRLDRVEVRVGQALLVQPGRHWCYLCSDPVCRPREGVPTESSLPAGSLAAANALAGRAVLQDRRELTRSVAFDPGSVGGPRAATPAEVRARYVDAERTLAMATASERDAAVVRATAARLVGLLATSPGAEPDLVSQTLVVVGLHDVRARDEALLSVSGGPSRVSLLVRLVAGCPPEWVAPVATVLAWHAYSEGDGATARVALDRALEGDPGYSLALMLDRALDAGVPPSVLAGVVLALR